MSRPASNVRSAIAAIELRICGDSEANSKALSTPRAPAAHALGRALAGDRASLLVEPAELVDITVLLREAHRHRVAMVVHCFGDPEGSAELPTLSPKTAQEAVDAAVIARRLAEEAMTPVLVFHAAVPSPTDESEPDLPEPAVLHDFVGEPGDQIDTPTDGQVIVFGDRRRRLQRLFDVDRPVSLGGRMAADEAWSAETGARLFFDQEVPRLAAELRRLWTQQTGREAPAVESPAWEAPSKAGARTAGSTWDARTWPRRQVLEARLRRLHPDLNAQAPPAAEAPSLALVDEEHLPLAARRLGRGEEVWDDVARFWTEHVHPRAGGAPPLPDPYLALLASPAWTATFYDQGGMQLPRLDVDRCTACGLCWQECPEASLAPLIVQTGDVLERVAVGIEGWDSSLRRHLRPLARRVDSGLASGNSWLEASGAACTDSAGGELDGVLDQLRRCTTELPLVAASTGEPHELLLLAVEPRSCTGCGLCAEECPEEALRLVPRSDDDAAAERGFRLWQDLPDTPGATIGRWGLRPEVGPVAASMLSHSCHGAVAGGCPGEPGEPGEPGDGSRIAVRQLAALIEEHMQRRLVGEAASLETLAGRSDGSDGKRVDEERLRGLRQRLIEGRTGAGRSRFGVVAAGASVVRWSGRFGHHPFGAPLMVLEGPSSLDVALGLAQAQAQRRADEARIVRRARLLLKRPADLVRQMDDLHRLGWSDLDAEERGSTPPVLLLADPELVATLDLAALARLRASSWPLWLVVLDDSGPEQANAGTPDAALLAAAAVLGLPVASTSIAAPSHLAKSVEALLSPDLRHGPAVLRIHAPSPSLARAALEAGHRAGVVHVPDPDEPYRFLGTMPEEAAQRASAETAEALRSEHESEVNALREEHADRLRAMAVETQAAQAAQLKARLMVLAGLGDPAPEREPDECSN